MAAVVVSVKTHKRKGPARASISVELELHFDPLDQEQREEALDKLFALLNQFGSPAEVKEISSQLLRKLQAAARPRSAPLTEEDGSAGLS